MRGNLWRMRIRRFALTKISGPNRALHGNAEDKKETANIAQRSYAVSKALKFMKKITEFLLSGQRFCVDNNA